MKLNRLLVTSIASVLLAVNVSAMAETAPADSAVPAQAVTSAEAQTIVPLDAPTKANAQADGAQKLREVLLKKNLTVPDHVRPTPIPDLYEVVIGPNVVYMTAEGRYLFSGNLVDVQTGQNLTEPSRSAARLEAINKVGEDNMIVFSPEQDKLKHSITVFTDIDCGFCRRLHDEIGQYNDKGIEVRYLFYPRAGVGSPSYDKAVSVWCADDRSQALTDAKASRAVAPKKCDNPIKSHMDLGEELGVTGTPALVLANGQVLPGYIPADRISAYLDAQKIN